jgi:hydrogenase maturation protein HypF
METKFTFTSDSLDVHTVEIRLTGLIQGIGFRPFVYRLATAAGLTGQVKNSNEGVEICVTGSGPVIGGFIDALREEAPPLSDIESLETFEVAYRQYDGFAITASSDDSASITRISPDIAVCSDCLSDMKKQPNRIRYPFTNCTNCGPRFTIINDLPYDRPATTMEPFTMCGVCRSEYENINDRRFHAQPVACGDCGPRYTMYCTSNIHGSGEADATENEFSKITGIDSIVQGMVQILADGGLIMIKGLGGFHMVCDARNENAVSRLRQVKKRDGKPLAVMCGSVDDARGVAVIDEYESALLQSVRRPIVLLRSRNNMPQAVMNNLDTIGVMLPYMPVHHLLFDVLPKGVCLVMTSGNFAGEPICIDNDIALEAFGSSFDAIVTYNRDIYNRVDDSVAMVCNGRPRLLRRSRGYVPAPVKLALDVDGIVAMGPDLKNTFAVGSDRYAIVSQHIGDLADYETTLFYEETMQRFFNLFRVKPGLLVRDSHPGFHSGKYADMLSTQGDDIVVVEVQHHHAHVAAVMAEHHLDRKVFGVSFDGTGQGDDGAVWGGEFLVCDLSEYSRFGHVRYFDLQGGDRASSEPWRSALALLWQTYGSRCADLDLPGMLGVPENSVEVVLQALQQHVGTHMTSSMGRLFDGVSALCGICSSNSFDAEAPIRLEHAAREFQDVADTSYYSSIVINERNDAPIEIDWRGLVKEIVNDKITGVPVPEISAGFHAAVAETVLAMAMKSRELNGISDVILSGGVFQNKALLALSENYLQKAEFTVYSALDFPANDGGIALGQLAVAAKRRELGCV